MTDTADQEIRRQAQELFNQQQRELEALDAESPIIPNPKRDAFNAARILLSRFFEKDGLPRLVRWRETWYTYYKQMWSERSEEDIAKFVHERLARCRTLDNEGNAHDVSPQQAVLNEILVQITNIVGIPTHFNVPLAREDDHWVEKDARGKMVCRGQIIDMLTQKVVPSNYIFVPNGAEWAWEPKCGKPIEWLKFIDSVFGENEADIQLLREWMGYVMSGDVWAQKGMIIVGPPRAGKGIIGHVLSALLGKSMVTSPTLSSLGKEFGLQSSLNKRLCLMSDARLSTRADVMAVVEVLLRVIAGDLIDVGRKYKGNLTTALDTRVMLLTNEMPQLYDGSDAINKRFLVIELHKSFYGHEDTGLLPRLLAELPAIAKWCCEGYRELRKRERFHETATSRAATNDWYEDTNPAVSFFNEHYEVVDDPESKVATTELYEQYKTWCENNGMKVLDSRWLTRRLTGWRRELKAVRSNNVRYLSHCRKVRDSTF